MTNEPGGGASLSGWRPIESDRTLLEAKLMVLIEAKATNRYANYDRLLTQIDDIKVALDSIP